MRRPILLVASLLTLASCTRGADAPPLRINSPLFDFDFEKTEELSISKNDPTTSDTWSARFKRDGKSSKSQWQIASAPEGRILSDRVADHGYIAHLLDTLKTLTASSEINDTPSAHYGLSPPWFALRWSSGSTFHELKLGNLTPDGRYAVVRGKLAIVQGAALQMLAHADTFDVFRRRVIALESADDVDELELYRGKRQVLYAQRQGDDWADRKNKRLKVPVAKILNDLTRLRAATFIEEAIPVPEDYRVVMKDRHGKPSILTLGIRDGKFTALYSGRPNAAFEL